MRVITTLFCVCAGMGFGVEGFAPQNRPIDVQHYDLTLTVDPAKVKNSFDAVVTLKIKSLKDLESIDLDAQNLTIQKVFWNSQPSTFKTEGDRLTIKLAKPSTEDSVGEMKIHYSGRVNVEQAGLFKVTDPDAPERGNLLFTQLEAIHARQFFPCNDEPADKASMDIGAIVPKGINVISSGILVSDKPVAPKGGKPWHEVRWSLQQPHSTYLANIAIGPFEKAEKLHGKLPVTVYAGKKAMHKTSYVLDTNVKAIQALEAYLHTAYPWPKYASVGLPTFVWGGMENTSTTFLNQDRMLLHDPKAEEEKLHLAMLTAHELGHQWFGDLVTMKWWDDIWLNEAFASFAGYKATEALFSKEEMAVLGSVYLWNEYFRQEDGPRSHPIVRKDLSSPDDAFDGISYTKGEQVLRMLEFYLGESDFRKGLALYLKEYAFSNADYKQFFASLEKVSGKDLKAFRDSWLLQRGYPVISYRTEWDESDRELKLTLEQKANHEEESSRFAFRMPVVFHRRTEPAFHQELTVEFGAKKRQTEILAALPAEPEWITLNPEGVILTRISVDTSAANSHTLSLQAQYDPDAVTRMWAVNELAKPLQTGVPMTKENEATIAQCLLNEKSPYVRIGMLNAFDKLSAKTLSPALSRALIEAYEQTTPKNAQWGSLLASDEHGWSTFRTKVLRELPKADSPKVFPLVEAALARPSATLDEVAAAAFAMASIGDKRSLPMLKKAMAIQGKRGYRYRFWVQYATAAIPHESTVGEIRKLASTGTADLMGKIPGVVQDNKVLKNSAGWAKFLEEFLTSDKKFGGVVKLRMLNTVEDVKSDAVKQMLTNLKTKVSAPEVKESVERMLQKNFNG